MNKTDALVVCSSYIGSREYLFCWQAVNLDDCSFTPPEVRAFSFDNFIVWGREVMASFSPRFIEERDLWFMIRLEERLLTTAFMCK